MALTKKQIKQLRAMANSLKPLFYVGKNDLTESAVNQADETIEKHELIKCAVQDGSGLTAKEAAAALPKQPVSKYNYERPVKKSGVGLQSLAKKQQSGCG